MVAHSRRTLRAARASTRQNEVGPDPVADGPDQLSALHPGGAQHPGGQGGHREEGAELLRVPLGQMPGHQHMVGAPGADGVGG